MQCVAQFTGLASSLSFSDLDFFVVKLFVGLISKYLKDQCEMKSFHFYWLFLLVVLLEFVLLVILLKLVH